MNTEIRLKIDKSTENYGNKFMSIQKTPHNLLEEMGLRLEKCRKKKYGDSRGSMKQCADELGTSAQNWNDYEAGKTEIGFGKVLYFAEFFDVDPTWLLTGEKTEKSPPKAGIEKSSRMATLTASAMKLQEHLNGIHRSALEGVITEDHFQEILDSAMDSIEKAVRRGKSTQKTTA